MTHLTRSPRAGIVIRDGRWAMLCGNTAVPIRLLDTDGSELPAIKPGAQTMFAREHDQEEDIHADLRQPDAN
jgi:hypothetical protein